MTAQEVHAKLKERFGDAIGPLVVTETRAGAKNPTRVDPFCTVDAAKIVDAGTFLKTTAGLDFDFLSDETAVDDPKAGKIRLVYHLFSYKHRHSLCLKAEVERAGGKIATLETVWKTAQWFEREIYDLFGVTFEGHSDLRRIMLPEDWEGHPLLKDYKEKSSYHNMATTRESPLEGFVRLDDFMKSARKTDEKVN